MALRGRLAGGLLLVAAAAVAVFVVARHDERPAPVPAAAAIGPAPDAFDVLWTAASRGRPDRLSGRRVDGTTVDLGPLAETGGMDLSADGRLLAYPAGTRGVAVVTLAGFTTRVLDVPFEVAPWVSSTVVWSPDGRTLAVVDGALPLEPGGVEPGQDATGFFLVDVATGATSRVAYPLRTELLAWSPDGTLLAVTPPQGGVDVITRGGRRVRRLDVAGDLARGHAWSPDGTRLLVGPDVVSAVTGAVQARLPAGGAWVWRDATHVARDDYHPHLVEDVVELDVASRRSRVLIGFDARTNPHGIAIRPAS